VRRELIERVRTLGRSFAVKLIVLLVIFVSVPLILYGQFEAADDAKVRLLQQAVAQEGRLIARAIQPQLETFDPRTPDRLTQAVARIAGEQTNVKLLLRPTGRGANEFFYIASNPAVSAEYLESERQNLIRTGVFEVLSDTCAGEYQLGLRFTNPAGAEEVLTSITPTNLRTGCWVLVTSHSSANFVGSSIGRPYWQSPEVRIAAAVYGLLVIIALSFFFDVWRSLSRFQRLAKDIRMRGATHTSFQRLNRIPELAGIAREFDHLVRALSGSARVIRQVAEENAHALKAPLAVISQSIEPLRRAIAPDDQRRQRALQLIERSVARLDSLVSASRRLGEATAESIDPPLARINLSKLTAGMVEGYGEVATARGVRFKSEIHPSLHVRASEDLLEVAIENVFDNAVGFSPFNSEVRVGLKRDGDDAVLTVEDRGPGVPTEHLDRIFDRYFSLRAATEGEIDVEDRAGHDNFGIGLWIVRRNIEAMGGSVSARNRPQGGFLVSARLPLTS